MIPAEMNSPATAQGSVSDDRQAFDGQVACCFTQAEQQGAALSVIVAGLDSFRLVNDSLGWEEGDRVLEEFRAIITSCTGSAYRVGGDMLAAVLPEAPARDAVSLAEQLRGKVASAVRTPVGAAMVSLGVTSYPEAALSARELIYSAEAAMYWAKASGGNRVGYWGEMISVQGNAWRRTGSVSDPIAVLVATLERKTGAPAGQSGRAAWYAKRVAKEMGTSPATQDLVERAAVLHDIGKLAAPDEILFKQGPLTEQEKAVVREHPLVGRDILSRIPKLAPVAQIVAHHHEHYDGSGYPDGLRGADIPIGSRIILVSDAFDALTTHRSYRDVLSLPMATRELERCSGQQFDPQVVAAFVQIVSRQGLGALHWSLARNR